MKSIKIVSIVTILALILPSFLGIPIPALRFGKDASLDTADYSFLGETDNDQLGQYCKIIKDVNGDGFDDLLISAYLGDAGGSQGGQIYLFFGGPKGWPKDTPASNANASIQINKTNQFLGESIDSAGDFNGDGINDIIIGHHFTSDLSGDAYLFLGRRTGWHQNMTVGDADTHFVGSGGEQLGASVAGVGDVNGDGYDDLVIGAASHSLINVSEGMTYLVLGKASGWPNSIAIGTAAAASFRGEGAGDMSGERVSAAGDVNGDGYNDILIGAKYNSNVIHWNGKAYVVFGRSSGWQANMPLSNTNASFTGEMVNSSAGSTVVGGGDVNGDGYDDFLVGAWTDNELGNQGGQVYLILGRPSGWQRGTNLSMSNASFRGGIIQMIGQYMSIAGDLDGDGLDDIVIGAPNTGGSSFVGETYVFPGKASGWAMDTDLDASAHSLVGQGYMELSGGGVSNEGDVDGDGLDDLLIGAYGNNQAANYAGKGYVMLADHNGGPSSITSLKAYTDATYTTEVAWADLPSEVFIELKGPGGGPSRIDTALINVTSTSTVRYFKLRLLETGLATNTYRGILHIRSSTRTDHDEIGATIGALINLTSLKDPSKVLTILVNPPLVRITPVDTYLNAFEDKEYKNRFVSTGRNPITKWTIISSANWLSWDGTAKTVHGTPDNGDVGTVNVTLQGEDGSGNQDQYAFKITVVNAPPTINTTDITGATQGIEYKVDYKADDEGQGNTSWSMTTNASWLHLNSTTGVLNGTSGPWDVWNRSIVNIVFDDGNGANTSHTFFLTVANVNDPPRIITQDVTTVLEDYAYRVRYSYVDPDRGDKVTVTFSTNASWLHYNDTNMELAGLPTNENVGIYWANITAMDLAKATDIHNFTLTVININDPPAITVSAPPTALVLAAYRFTVNVSDPDKGDRHKFSLDDAPANMTIGRDNGTILWYPTKEQRGANHVVVSVTDGNMSDTKAFDIQVSVPSPTLRSPGNGSKVTTLKPELIWDLNLATDLNITYDVYLDHAKDPKTLSAQNFHGKNTTFTTPLLDKSQYYWFVVPRAKTPSGAIIYGDRSDTWSFKVDTGFVADYTVILDLDNSTLKAKRGDTVRVTLTIQNKGNMEGNISIAIQSDLPANAILVQSTVHLKPKVSAFVIMTITVPKDQAYGDHTLTITASFGNYSSPKTLKLTIEKPVSSEILSAKYLPLWGGLIALIAGLIIGVAYMSSRRRRADEARVKSETELADVKAQADTVEDFTIDEIFLIYQDGRLISSVSYKEAAIDNQLFSSMLIALQGFVKESFQTEDGLSRFDFGTRKMVLEKGQYLFLAVALSGPEPKILKENMHVLVQKVEGLYAGVIENWDGQVNRFRDVNLMLAPLFDIKKGLKIKKEKEEVTVRSGIEFFGGYVRLKVAVSNDLSVPIKDIELTLTYDQMTLRLSHIQPEYPMRGSTVYLAAIEPNEKRTVAFYLDPLICQESHVDATVKFKDHYGNAGEAAMKRRPVDIVCPIFYTPENINVAMLRRLLSESQFTDNRIYAIPDWTDIRKVYEVVRQTVALHDIKLVRDFTDQAEGNFIGEAWYYGKTHETNEELLLKASVREQPRVLEIQVACSNMSSLTGLLAEVSINTLKLCQEKSVCTLVPCTEKEWKTYLATCETMLDRYGRQEQDGKLGGAPSPPATP
jgi:hypothetical protein